MRKSCWALALAVALLPAGSLNAANITITWTGSVSDGTDQSNTFGLGVGSDLTGQNFTAKFVVDPTVGFIQNPANFFDTRGGTDVPGFSSPILSAELSINSQTFAFLSDKFGGYTRDATLGRSNIYTEAQHQVGASVDILFLSEFLADNSIPFTGIDEDLDVALSAGTNTNFQAFQSEGVLFFAGHLNPTRVTISSAVGDGDGDGGGGGAVPEPSTALLLGTSIAALGILRRNRWLR
ncbi:MAG: PEP-CTERM sorting domain-containing protein [Acidobacteriota bacterium]